MPDDGVVTGDHGRGGGSRAAVLATLRRTGRPMSVAEMAEAQCLHVNTVRAYLDALVDNGFATRVPQRRATPGRPRMLYEATKRVSPDEPHPTVTSNYRVLAEVLVEQIASRSPHEDYREIGREAGRTWALATHDALPAGDAADEADAYARITRLMADLGFAPAPDPAAGRVVLHDCPFLDGPTEHLQIVCGVHHGLIEGTLARMHAPIRPDSLDVVLEPVRCVLHMKRIDEDTSGATPDDDSTTKG